MTHPPPAVPAPGPPAPSTLLDGLTDQQAQAVRYGTGPLLLIAGPGAGKTRTLTRRVAYLLASGQAQPSEILAVTFSVRAAGELRLRLVDLLGEQQARAVTASTFHSVCARLLREHAAVFGRTDQYTIYDQGDIRRVTDALIADRDRTALQDALARHGQPPVEDLLGRISRAKAELLTAADYTRRSRYPAAAVVSAVWVELERELQRSNAFDFDDLLGFTVRLLREYPNRLAWLRSRFRWVVVDEFQDVNRAQAEFVALMCAPGGNVAVVADDDQLIHRFRGADPQHVLRFADRYPQHGQIVLSHNFRCRSEIVHAAVRAVTHNENRALKTLIAARGFGGTVQCRAFTVDWQEANWIANHIATALANGIPGPEIMVLARTGYVTAPLQAALARAGIPHRVLGSLGLYERTEVKDALAYLTLLANPADAQALRRAISSPRRGVGDATVKLLVDDARANHGGDLIATCAQAQQLKSIRSPATGDRIASFGQALTRIRDERAAGRSLGHIVLAAAMLDGGLVAHYQHRRDSAPKPSVRADAERVLEDLRSLCRAAQDYEHRHSANASLTAFLEHAAGLHANELDAETDERVTISTIHRAKGTEATLVIVLGCEERLLPSWQSLASSDLEQLAEERRLFYVACTRAKDQLILTHTQTRNGRSTGGPSRFLVEAGVYRQPQQLAA